jgi:aspartate aminotransferase-like enzyme
MSRTRERACVVVSPGPVHVAPERWESLPLLHHRSDDFRNIFRETQRLMQDLLHTSSPVHVLTASGTGAMEAAVANVTVPGSRVLVVSGGKFGHRWVELCDTYECKTVCLSVEKGMRVEVDAVLEHVERLRPEFVALTHVESSTGLLFPLRELCVRLGQPRPVLIVDAISSLGAEELDMDAWGIDVVVAASQKALAAPPGVSFVGMDKRSAELVGRRRSGIYYFDLARSAVAAESGDTPFTPAIQTVQMIHRSLLEMKALGFDAVRDRHRRASDAFLGAAEHLSLHSYSGNPSSAVQALALSEGCRADDVLERLRGRGFIAAGGQGDLRGAMIRTGFLGLLDGRTLEGLVEALGTVLREIGCSGDLPSALKCARDYGAGTSLI